jgi:hypothetical protein
LEDVRHLLLELIISVAASDEAKSALAPVLYTVTDRAMAEQWAALPISGAMRMSMTTGRHHGRSRLRWIGRSEWRGRVV